MPHLKSLAVDGNPMKTIRRDILQRGTTELMKFLRWGVIYFKIPFILQFYLSVPSFALDHLIKTRGTITTINSFIFIF
jgi:hypothetical protein